MQRRFVWTEEMVGGSRVYAWFEEYSVPIDRAPVSGMFGHVGQGSNCRRRGRRSAEVLNAFDSEIGDEITFETWVSASASSARSWIRNRWASPSARWAQARSPASLAQPKTATSSIFRRAIPSVRASRRCRSHGQLEGGYGDPSLVMQGYANEGSVATRGTFAARGVALAGTALIAGAAFAVGAQRQLRTLGLIGAAGGESRHVRTTVLFGGVSLGRSGIPRRGRLGVFGAYALHPYLDRLADRFVGPVAIPFLPLLGAVALGTAAATLAALGPAHAAARLSTLEALAGRTVLLKPPGRWPASD